MINYILVGPHCGPPMQGHFPFPPFFPMDAFPGGGLPQGMRMPPFACQPPNWHPMRYMNQQQHLQQMQVPQQYVDFLFILVF